MTACVALPCVHSESPALHMILCHSFGFICACSHSASMSVVSIQCLPDVLNLSTRWLSTRWLSTRWLSHSRIVVLILCLVHAFSMSYISVVHVLRALRRPSVADAERCGRRECVVSNSVLTALCYAFGAISSVLSTLYYQVCAINSEQPIVLTVMCYQLF